LKSNQDLGWVWGIRPNHLYPPFDNPAARQALLPAIDPGEYLIAGMGTDPAGWVVPSGFFSPGSPMATDLGLKVLGGLRDLDKARRDLNAVYRGEKIVVITAGEGWILTAMNTVLVDMLKKPSRQRQEIAGRRLADLPAAGDAARRLVRRAGPCDTEAGLRRHPGAGLDRPALHPARHILPADGPPFRPRRPRRRANRLLERNRCVAGVIQSSPGAAPTTMLQPPWSGGFWL
jgi:hypothetical protein